MAEPIALTAASVAELLAALESVLFPAAEQVVPAEIDFSNRHFAEPVVIRGKRFAKPLRLDDSVFDAGLSITECQFDGRLSATGIRCNGKPADLADCTFADRVVIRPVDIALLSLRSGEFAKGFEIAVAPDRPMALDLRFSRIRGDCTIKAPAFRQAEYTGRVALRELELYESVLEKEASLELFGLQVPELTLSDIVLQDKASIYFVEVEATTIWMENVRVTDKANVSFYDVDFTGAQLAGTNMEKFVLSRVTWPQLDGRSCLRGEIDLREQLRKEPCALREREPASARERLAENYRQLVLNFEAKRNYELAEAFHMGEMEMARLDAEPVPTSRWRRWLRNFNTYWIYRFVSVYGTSYRRAALVMGALLLVFSALFLLNGLHYRGSKDKVDYAVCLCMPSSVEEWVGLGQDFVAAFGMTLSIATLQKDRPMDPAGVGGSVLSSLLLLLASSQAALLLFALRRKFRRASI